MGLILTRIDIRDPRTARDWLQGSTDRHVPDWHMFRELWRHWRRICAVQVNENPTWINPFTSRDPEFNIKIYDPRNVFYYSHGICTDWFNKYCKNYECTWVYDGSHTSLFLDNSTLLVLLLVALYCLYIAETFISHIIWVICEWTETGGGPNSSQTNLKPRVTFGHTLFSSLDMVTRHIFIFHWDQTPVLNFWARAKIF